MAENKVKSFYLPPDVLEYLATHENASATLREAEAQAYERIHGRPLSDRARERARRWSREQLDAAAEHATEHRKQTDELRRRMGWAA
jgi:hypothetical protein